MNNKKLFRVIVWLMLIAMVASTLFVIVEPILYGL